MNSNELLDILGDVRSEYILEAQKHRTAPPATQTRHSPIKRILLIAAVVALLAAMVGFAAIVLNLSGLKLGTFDGDLLSLQGMTGSKNYLAAQEWRNYLDSYDPDKSLLKQSEETHYYVPDTYEAYICYTDDMMKKVDEICKKYGLHPLGPIHPEPNVWSLLTALGLQNILDGDHAGLCEGGGYYYEDGTFQIDGTLQLVDATAPWIYPVDFQYRSVKKTAFDGVFINVWDISRYQEWNYTTKQGIDVLIALCPEHALIFADSKDAFVTVSILNTRVGDVVYGEQEMDKAALEAIADILLLNVEAQYRNPWESTVADYDKTFAQVDAANYWEALKDTMKNLTDPENLLYAMYDVNDDGTNELLLARSGQLVEEIVTMRNGKTAFLSPGWRYRFYKDGVVERVFENTDGSIMGQFVRYNGAEEEDLVWVKYFEHTDGSKWWKSEGGRDTITWTAITQAEYNELCGNYKSLNLKMKPITKLTIDDVPTPAPTPVVTPPAITPNPAPTSAPTGGEVITMYLEGMPYEVSALRHNSSLGYSMLYDPETVTLTAGTEHDEYRSAPIEQYPDKYIYISKTDETPDAVVDKLISAGADLTDSGTLGNCPVTYLRRAEGQNWDSKVVTYAVIETAKGTFIGEIWCFLEAQEGFGARAQAMLNTISFD